LSNKDKCVQTETDFYIFMSLAHTDMSHVKIKISLLLFSYLRITR